MNRNDAKKILLLYRTEADAADPQIAEALALAKSDAELSRWFDAHRAAQDALREKFRQIEIPGGLMQQIISEQKAKAKTNAHREKMVLVAAIAAILISISFSVIFLSSHPLWKSNNSWEADGNQPNTLAHFESSMIYFATGGYQMNLATNDLTQIKNYLVQNQAPVNYTLPTQLEKAATTGCAVEDWKGAKVAMICFTIGKPLQKNQSGDLWLFVVDRSAIKDAPQNTSPQIASINGITTAVWTNGDKLYLLGVAGDEQTLRKYL